MSQTPMSTDHERLLQAIRHFQAGDMVNASLLAQALFNQDPHHAEAVHLLGLIADRTDRTELAVKLLSTAVDLEPWQIRFRIPLGDLYSRLGQFEAAANQYRQALRLQADPPTVLHQPGPSPSVR